MKMNHLLRTFIGISIAITLYACEDVIDVKLDKGDSQLAVDALVIVNDGRQTIRLTKTTQYFDNGTKASGVSGASVQIRSNKGQVYVFTENPSNPGNYISEGAINGETGEIFGLVIQYEGQTFGAGSILVRGTKIDSLYQEDLKAQFGNEAGKYLYLKARDPIGTGDFCWIKYSLNGKQDLRYNRLNGALPVDAAFNPGAQDGLEFIFPIRNSINGNKGYIGGDTITVDTKVFRPADSIIVNGQKVFQPADTIREKGKKIYVPGDTIAVDLLSIDGEQWRFLKEMDIQLNNTGLFANPIANIRGNITNTDANSKVQAVGCFGMARVSRAGVRIK